MDLVDLTNRENHLYSIVLEVQGTMEEKNQQLRQRRVFDDYRQVHSSYAESADKNVESLKRGLFIQWYGITEPSCFTGINDLDENSEPKIIEKIDGLIIADKLDYELRWILTYYFNWVLYLNDLRSSNHLRTGLKIEGTRCCKTRLTQAK